jgi:diacylglycerol kinase
MADKKLSFIQTFGSVLASFAGIQNNAKRERDFKQGRARDFIAVGALITVLFIAAVYGVVQLVMSLAISG